MRFISMATLVIGRGELQSSLTPRIDTIGSRRRGPIIVQIGSQNAEVEESNFDELRKSTQVDCHAIIRCGNKHALFHPILARLPYFI